MIRAADPVLYIVPADQPFVIAARVAPINIDEIAIGQPVTLRFAAFDSAPPGFSARSPVSRPTR